MSVFCYNILECGTEDDVLGVAGDGTLVLSPKERPIVVVLKVVGLTEQQAGGHVAGNF